MDIDAMLCDHAQVAGGKLFISGANIDRIRVSPNVQPPYVMSFAVAGIVRVPWGATNQQHDLSFRLLTEDGQNPALPEAENVSKSAVGGDFRFNVGRPPTLASGDEQLLPFAFSFNGLPLMQTGRFIVILSMDGPEVRRLRFTVEQELSGGYSAHPGA